MISKITRDLDLPRLYEIYAGSDGRKQSPYKDRYRSKFFVSSLEHLYLNSLGPSSSSAAAVAHVVRAGQAHAAGVNAVTAGSSARTAGTVFGGRVTFPGT